MVLPLLAPGRYCPAMAGKVHMDGSEGAAEAAADNAGVAEPAETGSIQNAPPAPVLGATAHIAVAGRTLGGRVERPVPTLATSC